MGYLKWIPVGASDVIQWPSPKLYLLKQKHNIGKKWEKVCCSPVLYTFFQLSENVESFFGAIFLGNRDSAVILWYSVTLDLMTDSFQIGWKFWKKASSCRFCEMRCWAKAIAQVKVSHGNFSTEAPEHPQGHRAEGHLKPGKTLVGTSTQAKARTQML